MLNKRKRKKRLGLRPRPHWGSYRRSPRPPCCHEMGHAPSRTLPQLWIYLSDPPPPPPFPKPWIRPWRGIGTTGLLGCGHVAGADTGGGGGGFGGCNPPFCPNSFSFARSFRGFWGLQPPLLSKNLVFCTHADSTPPPPRSVNRPKADSTTPLPPARGIGRKRTALPPPPRSSYYSSLVWNPVSAPV